MSILANIDWPAPPVVSSNGTKAARSLRSYVWAKGAAKGVAELKGLAEKVPGARWRDYMRLCLFQRVDWGDGTDCSVSTVATLCGVSQAIDNAMLLMTSLRAEQQALGAARVLTRYRVVIELDHVVDRTVCWLDVETGEVIAGEVWRKAEEKRLAAEKTAVSEEPEQALPFIRHLHEDDGDTIPTRPCDFEIEGTSRDVVEACKRDFATLSKWDYYITCEKKRLKWRVWQAEIGSEVEA